MDDSCSHDICSWLWKSVLQFQLIIFASIYYIFNIHDKQFKQWTVGQRFATSIICMLIYYILYILPLLQFGYTFAKNVLLILKKGTFIDI